MWEHIQERRAPTARMTWANVPQWTETIVDNEFRTLRGSSFVQNSPSMNFISNDFQSPQVVGQLIGFRVAMIPEPSSFILAAFGFLALAWRFRRRNAPDSEIPGFNLTRDPGPWYPWAILDPLSWCR